MKALVGTAVVTGCVLGLLGWALVERHHGGAGLDRGALTAAERRDPCVLPEVACRSAGAGVVYSASFAAQEVSGDSRSADLAVSCLRSGDGAVWELGLVFGGFVPSGGYAVRWASLGLAAPDSPLPEWSSVSGFLVSPDAAPFVDAALRPLPLAGRPRRWRSGRGPAGRVRRRRRPAVRGGGRVRRPARPGGSRGPGRRLWVRLVTVTGESLVAAVLVVVWTALFCGLLVAGLAAHSRPSRRRRRRR